MVVRRYIPWGLLLSAALLASCVFPTCPAAARTATLKVDINYTDTFYREVFRYTRQAENIRHWVLVLPAELEDRANPGPIFHALQFQSGPDIPLIEDPEFVWATEYLYEAPGGTFTGEFAPGAYAVAVAFIAAPLSREEADVSEDTILYAGVTGGGASTQFMQVILEAGQTTDLRILLNDDNGWACPWLYVDNGLGFERRTEVLRNLRGKPSEQTELTRLADLRVIGGGIVLKLAEEKHETAWVDELYLLVEGFEVRADGEPSALTSLDGDYLTLTEGESVELHFTLPPPLAGREQVSVTVVTSGYYVPGAPLPSAHDLPAGKHCAARLRYEEGQ